MPIEFEILTFSEWFLPSATRGGALLYFLSTFALLSVLGLLAWYLVAAYFQGPSEAFYSVAKVVYKAFSDDLPRFSLRRTLAMAQLTVLEAIRRKIIWAFVVFVLLLMFASLFLDGISDNPARIYLSIVLNSSYFLILLLSVVLSTFSLPNEVKNRTIYSLVTKPIRAGEIVLGKILGFTVIGTVVLAVMCVVSYGFVVRGLNHRHVIEAENVERTGQGDSLAATGKTSTDSRHHHNFTLGPDGLGRTEMAMGHWHEVEAVRDGDKIRYEVGPHEGLLVARVPKYGKLRFLDSQGRPGKGISVGQEWAYRSYVEGRTQAAAIWTFEGVTPDAFPQERFPDGLPIEMNLRVFRTTKGDIVSPIVGEIIVVNPSDRSKIRRSETLTFPAREFVRSERTIPWQLKGVDAQGQVVDVDLLKDLVDQGRLEIHIRCGQAAQYFGMAQPDLFVQAGETSFAENFAKGHISIWLQMVMVISLGVMFSTFLSGPVSLLAMFISFSFGYFSSFVTELFQGVFQGTDPVKTVVRNLFNIEEGTGLEGGGPLESIYRIFRQLNLSAELELGFAEKPIQYIDMTGMLVMRLLLQLFPDFSRFDNSDFVEFGFAVDPDLLLIQTVTALAFSASAALIGYFFLKTRELAA
jgi:ABC-type transport system involved in multi-copper enzyme maturation permease subunit